MQNKNDSVELSCGVLAGDHDILNLMEISQDKFVAAVPGFCEVNIPDGENLRENVVLFFDIDPETDGPARDYKGEMQPPVFILREEAVKNLAQIFDRNGIASLPPITPEKLTRALGRSQPLAALEGRLLH